MLGIYSVLYHAAWGVACIYRGNLRAHKILRIRRVVAKVFVDVLYLFINGLN